jgi:hypothetical protein
MLSGGESQVAGGGRKRKSIGLVGLIAAGALALPAASLAATPQFLFSFPAGHGYTLLGSATTEQGTTEVSIQLNKQKLQGKDVYYEELYAWSGFKGTYSANSKHTHATLSANLGSYGSVSLTFSNPTPAKVVTLKCPGSNKKTKIDKGVELGTATGSLSFDTQTSYFGTVKGHKSKSAELEPLGSFLATRQAADPMAAAATSTGILACIPSLTGKITYLTLPAQGGSAANGFGENTFFAARLGNDTLLNATENGETPTGPITERSISVSELNGAGKSLFSFAPSLSSATAKTSGPFLSGSSSYKETTPCSNTSAVTYGSSTGAITAKFDSGGDVTYGGAGTVGEMDKLPGPVCDNPPTGAPG